MTERCMTEWCEAIRLTKCQSDNEGTEPTLAQRRPNHHQKRQAINEGTEPPLAWHHCILIKSP